MVSKTLASLDAWLALADEVLAEQHALQEQHQRPRALEDEGGDDHGSDGLSAGAGNPRRPV